MNKKAHHEMGWAPYVALMGFASYVVNSLRNLLRPRTIRETVNAAIVDNGKILLVRKKQSWLLPGGKPEMGESDIECLCREVREELSGTELKNIRPYDEFIGLTHVKERFRTKVYLADVNGKLGEPSAEIAESRWVDDTSRHTFSDMNLKVMDSLVRNGYINRPSG